MIKETTPISKAAELESLAIQAVDAMAQAGQFDLKITAPGIRFAVFLQTQDGRVYQKDKLSEHWTTNSRVLDMTRTEADAVVAHELAKHTTSTYEIVDLDERAQVIRVRSAAARAVCASVGYEDWTKEKRFGPEGEFIRAASRLAADLAEARART
ncbi:hypothetical protein SJI00_21025 [Pseudomonas sp. RP23018S]|uniref:hypothetical protein n=1 Tax=Pseudomonas sp. RP23018S TaxID=3096037 RepID=UPI002ACACF76|nr:hypothetical protein [Pseudomonas sp. RP23018S]MDZ5605260.1 hypothetical protein [Pseudomonas sp. RP23018S]